MRRSILAAAALAVLAAPTASLADCLSKDERSALQIRALQTELMVGALSCRAVVQEDMISEYNAFAKKHEQKLMASGKTLVGYFHRLYGSQSRPRHDAFITALANVYSRQSMIAPDYCETSAALLGDAARLDRRDLESYSAKRARVDLLDLGDCAVAQNAPAKR